MKIRSLNVVNIVGLNKMGCLFGHVAGVVLLNTAINRPRRSIGIIIKLFVKQFKL